MVAFMNFEKIEKWFKDDDVVTIAIVTDNDEVFNLIKSNTDLINPNAEFKQTGENEAYKLLETKDIASAYIINSGENNKIDAKIVYESNISENEKLGLQNLLSEIQFHNTSKEFNLTETEIFDLLSISSVVIEKYESSTTKKYEDSELQLLEYIAYISILITFIVIITYSNQAALEISNEKNSKVMETVITSVTPIVHLWANILALILAALTQVFVIVVSFLICYLMFDTKELFAQLDLEVNGNTIFVAFVSLIFVFLGLTTYIILAMIIGTMTSNLENLNQAVIPLNMLLFIPMYLIIFNLDTPNDSLITTTSFIPLFSPFIMIFRLSNPDLSIFEILASISLSVLLIVLLSWIASRGYKSSLLTFDTNFIGAIKRYIYKS